MMRKLNYIGMLLLLFAIHATYGQNNHPEPRRTAEEQAAFEKTIKTNPAKIPASTHVETRIEPVTEQPGTTNWKPAITPADERDTPPVQPARKTTTINTAPDRTQPAGEPGGKIVNYRELKGPKEQPQAPNPVNVVNRRDLKGPSTQPQGDKPGKK